VLKTKVHELSPVSVSNILKEEGFARLPRRKDDERPPGTRPTVAQVADVRGLSLTPQKFRTKFGGLFLFVPFLAAVPLDHILNELHFPGSKTIPAGHAIRSLLTLKLFGSARHSDVMSYVLYQRLALFSGLNAITKRVFLIEYGCRINPTSLPQLMQRWFEAMEQIGIDRGVYFVLDFHTIPFHGEDALVEKHYVSKRSRKQKDVLAFLAQDDKTRLFC
jgi:hypothetical protein